MLSFICIYHEWHLIDKETEAEQGNQFALATKLGYTAIYTTSIQTQTFLTQSPYCQKRVWILKSNFSESQTPSPHH